MVETLQYQVTNRTGNWNVNCQHSSFLCKEHWQL